MNSKYTYVHNKLFQIFEKLILLKYDSHEPPAIKVLISNVLMEKCKNLNKSGVIIYCWELHSATCHELQSV